jgi:L-lactate dehydrogenase complex protein LldE
MKVGLFIPCYIDAFFPEVGVATLELLERLGCSVEYPLGQTCCGQPMANSGCQDDAAETEAHFVRCFQDFDTVVGPSGSCVHHVRFHLDAIEQTPQTRKVRAGTRELVEFLHDDLKVEALPWAAFPHRVGMHDSCSAVRGLGHTRPSELVNEPYFSKTRDLLAKVRGVELIEIDRATSAAASAAASASPTRRSRPRWATTASTTSTATGSSTSPRPTCRACCT